ncbi:MAG TPA: HD domain-containing protein [Desulfuromonadales bacterium]|nr:HD domain-containing protein [Desulfuromonadales bacterium]
MGAINKEKALHLITLFSGAVKGVSFYPAAHPAIRQPLMELYNLLSAALIAETKLSWGVIDGLIFFDDHIFSNPSTAIADLTNRMVEKEISRIVVTSSLRFEEMETFVKLFSVKGTRFEALARQMADSKITGLTILRHGAENFDPESEELEIGDDHREMYGRAVTALRTVCREIERGRIPGSAQVVQVVDQMVEIISREPLALLGLAMIRDYDNYTFTHSINVGVLAMSLGAVLGLDSRALRDLGIAGQLHDIGKTMVPKTILNKPGKLSSTEFDEMKLHPELGSKIIKEMEGLAPHLSSIVLGHHLHYNRSGYPEWANKLPFDQLMDIIAVADTYDAMTTLRVYQHPINPKKALDHMKTMTNTILDGAVVARFVEMMGTYPVGTLVRLDTNEVAIVYRPNPSNVDAPLVRILFEESGKRLRAPREQALVEPDGTCYARIVAVVDPLLKNIEIGQWLANGNQ